MILINDPRDPDLINYFMFKGGFNNDEINKIEGVQKKYSLQQAVLSEQQEHAEDIRQSLIKELPSEDEECQWIFMKFAQMAAKANEEMWGFDLTGMLEDLQYAVYPAGAGFYNWHMDVAREMLAHRKISITLQLSDADEYEGGELEILVGSSPIQVPKDKGTAILFPSYFMHRVKPVTKGERRSLVLWVSGPPYR